MGEQRLRATLNFAQSLNPTSTLDVQSEEPAWMSIFSLY